jgi:hypothetical protein
MHLLHYVLYAAGFYPLYRAWRAARRTSLFHAVCWGIAAWLAWGVVLAEVVTGHPNPAIFVALCLTGCAGVAVLGARRPQVVAWNFVVLGLLAVMLLPLVETTFLRAPSLDGMRIAFLAVTLGVGLLNYLPTRFGPAAFLLGLGCAWEMIAVLAQEPLPRGREEDLIRLCWLVAPLLALLRGLPRGPEVDLDTLWRDFRDRWGLVWAQRVCQQFNQSAANHAWPVTLTWFGFQFRHPVDDVTGAEIRQALTALLRRFLEVDEQKK